MTIKLEKTFQKDRYKKGYDRSLNNGWPIRTDTLKQWERWIADPDVQSAYVEGRINGLKERRLRKLLAK